VFLRFSDLRCKLAELPFGQFAVLVVVESFDEVDRSFLGEVELALQDLGRLLKTDETTTRILVTVN